MSAIILKWRECLRLHIELSVSLVGRVRLKPNPTLAFPGFSVVR